MAEAPASTTTDSAGSAALGSAESKAPLFLGLANTLALVAAAGTFFYTRILFERPKITEQTERTRLEAEHERPKAPSVPELVAFANVTANLRPDAVVASAPAAPALPGRMRYATIGYSVEIRDAEFKNRIESARARIMDQFLQTMGKKQVHDINDVVGRNRLKTQMIEFINAMVTADDEPPVVTNIHFATFILQ